MEHRIRQHIEGLFANAPKTSKATELKEEMILNIIERYHDLVNDGMSEEDAFRSAITGIGDVSELIAGLYADPAAQAAQGAQPAGQSAPYYAPPAQSGPAPRKKGNTAAIVVAIICGTILLLTLVTSLAGASIMRSLFSKDGFLSNVVDPEDGILSNVVDSAIGELGSSGITWNNGGSIVIGGDDEEFSNAYSAMNSYTVTAEGIKKLEINWVTGSVTVEPYDGTEIEFVEESASLTEENALRYRVKGDTLTIRFSKNKSWSGVNWGSLNINSIIPPKALTVRIPASMLENEPELLELNAVSNSVSVTGIPVGTLRLNTVSGEAALADMAIGSIKLDAVSGNIKLENCAVGSARIHVISGGVLLGGAFGSVKMDSVSGDLTFDGSLGSLDVDAVSGGVKLTLEDCKGYKLDFDSVSGEYHEPGAASRDGRREGKYSYGDSSAEFDVDTVSGDLWINVK